MLGLIKRGPFAARAAEAQRKEPKTERSFMLRLAVERSLPKQETVNRGKLRYLSTEYEA